MARRRREASRSRGSRPLFRRGEEREELVLCVGNPPTLRNLLALGSARVVVIEDLERAWRFLAERPVSRILVDLGVLTRQFASGAVPIRQGRAETDPTKRSRS